MALSQMPIPKARNGNPQLISQHTTQQLGSLLLKAGILCQDTVYQNRKNSPCSVHPLTDLIAYQNYFWKKIFSSATTILLVIVLLFCKRFKRSCYTVLFNESNLYLQANLHLKKKIQAMGTLGWKVRLVGLL